MVYRNIDYYNLDMIISVGFRVNSRQGILFGLMLNDIFKEGELKENEGVSKCKIKFFELRNCLNLV